MTKEWSLPWELLPENEELAMTSYINDQKIVHVIDGKRGHKLIVGKAETQWHQWNEFIRFKGILASPRAGNFRVAPID
jgi:hypothetical protein